MEGAVVYMYINGSSLGWCNWMWLANRFDVATATSEGFVSTLLSRCLQWSSHIQPKSLPFCTAQKSSHIGKEVRDSMRCYTSRPLGLNQRHIQCEQQVITGIKLTSLCWSAHIIYKFWWHIYPMHSAMLLHIYSCDLRESPFYSCWTINAFMLTATVRYVLKSSGGTYTYNRSYIVALCVTSFMQKSNWSWIFMHVAESRTLLQDIGQG